MIRDLSKSAALLNAQAVMVSASLFGHGDVITLSVNDAAVVLTITYDFAWFVYVREIEWLMDRCMCGVQHWMKEDRESRTFNIFVSWSFNPNLK